ncbi:DGQHR domain-containing protein DpdB [Marinobacterium stanieri]|uniref:DGQHR domain-containing protein DpdB n=1 Tax=Marinobacterium stanieri TaxID=49186 RepID=UPI003A903C59
MNTLKVPALRIKQGSNRYLYSAAINGKLISEIASISRVRRHDSLLDGYQRPEVSSHITEIKNYIDSENPLIPNAIVIAFDKTVTFDPITNGSDHGYLSIPYCNEQDIIPGFVVDGQQRSAALREAGNSDFVMPVSAFIASSVEEQREQFMLVNSTKPLPKGLLYELAPHTTTRLSSSLQKKKFPYEILERLNFDSDSPLCGKINTPTNPEGMIKDNSILKMIESSLSDGALYRFRDPATGRGDIDKMVDVLVNFWLAVRDTWEDQWGKKPRDSRLLHGVGILSLGALMDAIADRHYDHEIPSYDIFYFDLQKIVEYCKWDHGFWSFSQNDQRKWNDLQNTSKDIQLLLNYLVGRYLRSL